MKILVVDDDAKIRSIIKKYAEFEGFEVDEANDGMDAVRMTKQNEYDILIVDVMMPELDGFWAVTEIRKTSAVPVIMLSARGEEYDRIHGFEVGADDYVTKPFSPRELMLSIKAVIARSGKSQAEKPHKTLESQGISLDTDARLLTVDKKQVQLAPKEYELLLYMMENKNLALSREQLLKKVWGFDYYGDDRTLDTHIKLLRKSLGKYSESIVTVRGMGYRFETKD